MSAFPAWLGLGTGRSGFASGGESITYSVDSVRLVGLTGQSLPVLRVCGVYAFL